MDTGNYIQNVRNHTNNTGTVFKAVNKLTVKSTPSCNKIELVFQIKKAKVRPGDYGITLTPLLPMRVPTNKISS